MEILVESRIVWARSGNKVKRKIRCTTGKRRGRIVSTVGACNRRIDIKKRYIFKRAKQRFKSRMSIKRQRTKRYNPISRRVRRLNRQKGHRNPIRPGIGRKTTIKRK
jgi:hypothetical protein